MGLGAQAYPGSTASAGVSYALEFRELMNTDSRIVAAYETLGTLHYTMKVIDTGVFRMRGSLNDLDDLAPDLATSLVTKRIMQD